MIINFCRNNGKSDSYIPVSFNWEIQLRNSETTATVTLELKAKIHRKGCRIYLNLVSCSMTYAFQSCLLVVLTWKIMRMREYRIVQKLTPFTNEAYKNDTNFLSRIKKNCVTNKRNWLKKTRLSEVTILPGFVFCSASLVMFRHWLCSKLLLSK